MFDEELVAEGIAWVQRFRDVHWEGGDLGLRVAPMYEGDVKRARAAEDAIAEWMVAIDCSVSLGQVMKYREVAYAWPPDRRVPLTSWTAHKVLAGHPDRFDILESGMSENEARIAAGMQRLVRLDRSHVSYLDGLAYLRTAVGYLRSASRAFGPDLSSERLEVVGDQLAVVEATVDAVYESAGMAEPVS